MEALHIGTHLKHNKYIFDIPIPFCHNIYLSATLKDKKKYQKRKNSSLVVTSIQ
jgi:hypothetical protein